MPGEVREAHNGLGVALAAGAITLISLTYNLLRITELSEASQGRTGLWFTAAVLALLACLVLAVRTRARPPLTRFHWCASAREALGHARWLRAHVPDEAHDPDLAQAELADRWAAELADRWAGELARLASDLDAEVVAQATALGPWLFRAAAYHDGEIEVPRVAIPPPVAGSAGAPS